MADRDRSTNLGDTDETDAASPRGRGSRLPRFSPRIGAELFSTTSLLATFCALVLLGAPLRFFQDPAQDELALQLAGAFALALAGITPGARAALRSGAVPLGALLLLAALAWLQSIPLPEFVVAALSPEHARLTQQAAHLFDPPREPTFYLSLAPEASRGAALAWATVAAFFFAAHCVGPRRRLAVAILIGGLVQVGASLPWPGEFVDVEQVPDIRRLRITGSLGATAYLASYLEIGLAVTFATGWWLARSIRPRAGDARTTPWLAAPIVIWLVLFTGLMLTGSRAGFIAALAALVFQGGLALTRFRGERFLLGGVVAALGAAGAIAAIGIRPVLVALLDNPIVRAIPFQRGTNVVDEIYGHGRLDYWELSLDAWSRFPWLGTGQGSFWTAYQLVHPEWAGRGETVYHAHNDLLELLTTGGVVGLALVTLALAAATRMLWRNLSRSSGTQVRAAALAGIGALLGAGLLDLTVFGLLKPANAVTLAVVLGAASSQLLSATGSKGARTTRDEPDPAEARAR